jgi:hypothetical protein
MKILPIVVMTLFAGTAMADMGGELEPVVPVCVNEGVNAVVLNAASAMVSAMFAKIGVTIQWLHQERLCRSMSGVISIELSDDTPKNQLAGTLAYALPFEGTSITIFYDRVRHTVEPPAVPYLLAHVMAHEIAHILEGTDRHSDSGVMKAYWDSRDEERMCRKPLTFTDFDVLLIHMGLEARR